ncbi:MAG TPA: zinc ribbon domain-containing protein [Actinocrinis sp.]|nr:zinc ribbon domain-containing protein [Actinocrinis sp.]
MPRYEYRCRACGQTFEKTRPMAEASAPISCPDGHDDTVKLFSAVAVSTGAVSSAPAPRAGGGCCGGGCCS